MGVPKVVPTVNVAGSTIVLSGAFMSIVTLHFCPDDAVADIENEVVPPFVIVNVDGTLTLLQPAVVVWTIE